MNKFMTFKTIDQVEGKVTNVNGMKQEKKMVVFGETADQNNVNFFKLGPGIGNTANVYHYHAISEEVFYIISGNGYMRTPEGNRDVVAGEIIVCPAHAESAHQLCNNSDTEELIYMNVAMSIKPDIMFIPDENGGFVFAKDEIITWSRNDKVVTSNIPAANNLVCKG
jgi:uncharacterized cupin superfamily protein